MYIIYAAKVKIYWERSELCPNGAVGMRSEMEHLNNEWAIQSKMIILGNKIFINEPMT
jgi:hypothetical protein